MGKGDSSQRKRDILLFAQRIAELPRVQKKVLAMYYFENLPLADIAACLGLSKIKVCEILVETSAQLFLADHRTPRLKDRQKVASGLTSRTDQRQVHKPV